MLVVSSVSAPVVQIVDVISVRDGHVPAALTVDMVVILVHGVAGRFAFVVVIVMPSMKVTVVHIVHMVAMRDRDVPASLTVDVVMVDVFAVSCTGHGYAPPFRPKLDS
jgi:hypothetical protein